MTRKEFGSYSVLKLETVNHALKRMQGKGLIDGRNRQVLVHSLEKFMLFANRGAAEP